MRAPVLLLSTILIAAVWAALLAVVGLGAEEFIGYWLADRFAPFSNVHLLEEVDEGLYAPLSDPVFVLHAVVIAALAFGVPTYFLGRRAKREPPLLTSIPALIVISIIAFLWRYVWYEGYPLAMQLACLFEIFLYIAAAAIASALSAASSRHG
jgi:hypothetical protein